MIRKLLGITLLVTAVLLPCSAQETDTLALPVRLSGILDPSDGIFLLAGRTCVPADGELLIRPGCTIICDSGSVLDIRGTLTAEGTARQPIVFTGKAGTRSGSWEGITIQDTRARARLRSTLVYGALTGIRSENPGALTIRDCGFISCRQAGLFCEGDGQPITERSVFTGGDYGAVFFNCPAGALLSGCTFSDARLAGVYCFAGSAPDIRQNIITACAGVGVRIAGKSAPLISGNLISGNATGISCTGSGPRIEANTIHHNRHYGIISHRSTPYIRNNNIFAQGLAELKATGKAPVDARFNWWGTNILAADTPEGNVSFRHLVRQRFIGPVHVSNFLVSPYYIRLEQPRSIAAIRIDGTPETNTAHMGETALLTVHAEGASPFAPDVVTVSARHLALPDRLVRLVLMETGPATGMFRARIPVTSLLWGNLRIPAAPDAHAVAFSAGNTRTVLSIEGRRPVADGFAAVSAFGKDDSRLPDKGSIRFEWQYTDPDFIPEPQRAWELEIATSPAFETAAVVCRRQGAGTISHHILENGPLGTGIPYFARLRVKDSRQWSGWVQTSFALNTPPPVPDPVFPADDMELKTGLWPVLVAGTAEDHDGDQLSYQFELYRDSACRELLDRGNGTRAQVYTAWQSGRRLEENGTYWWRVRATDGYETGRWSPLRSFALNLVEEPMYPFALSAPDHASLATDEQITFRWEPAKDPDPGTDVSYTLWLADDPGFTNRIVVNGLRENRWKAPFPLANGTTWYWKVKAVGSDGTIAWCNVPALPHYSFTTFRHIIASE